jgi:hypothetical protein
MQSHPQVEWVHAGLVDAALPPAGFDVVSAQYPALNPPPTQLRLWIPNAPSQLSTSSTMPSLSSAAEP